MNSPVFIVGEARSGTSIAHRCLLLHPTFRLANGSTTALAETAAFVQPRTLLHNFQANPGLWEYLLQEEQAVHDVVQQVAQFRAAAERWWSAYRYAKKARIASQWLWQCGHYADILHRFFEIAQQVRGQRRLLDKSPVHVFTIPEIFWTYPDARVIYLARDPVATFASYRKRLQRERAAGHTDDELQWLQVTAQGLAARLVRNWRLVSAAHRRWPRQVAVIHYDQFVGDYTNMMATLLRWLGEDPTVTEPDQAGERWDADPQLMSGIRSQTEACDEFVTTDEAKLLHRQVKPAQPLLESALLTT